MVKTVRQPQSHSQITENAQSLRQFDQSKPDLCVASVFSVPPWLVYATYLGITNSLSAIGTLNSTVVNVIATICLLPIVVRMLRAIMMPSVA